MSHCGSVVGADNNAPIETIPTVLVPVFTAAISASIQIPPRVAQKRTGVNCPEQGAFESLV